MTEPKKRKPIVKRKTRKVVPKIKQTETRTMEEQETASIPEPKIVIEEPVAFGDSRAKPENTIVLPAKSAARRERIPLGAPRLKLSAPERPGYRRRWINDVGGRLEQAEAGGYDFVTDDGLKIGETALGSGNQDLGSRVSRIVGTQADGQPQRAFLMEIKEEWYNEDHAEKQKRLDLIDAQIKGGTFNPENDNDTKRYVPTEGISIK